ncbi:unnamed protein product, partial [Allacma fusca]
MKYSSKKENSIEEWRAQEETKFSESVSIYSTTFSPNITHPIIASCGWDKSVKNTNGDRTSDFDVKLMNVDQEHLGIPETDYACTIKMPSGEWSRIVRDLSQFGESIVISCAKKGVQFSSTGDIGTANVKLAPTSSSDEESISIDLQEPVTLTFAARYLQAFSKAAGLSDQVVLSMTPDVPLVVEFKIGDLGAIIHIFIYINLESLNTGEIPRDSRRANVVPIFKSGAKENVSNYRPLSIVFHLHGTEIAEPPLVEGDIQGALDSFTKSLKNIAAKHSCVKPRIRVFKYKSKP